MSNKHYNRGTVNYKSYGNTEENTNREEVNMGINNDEMSSKENRDYLAEQVEESVYNSVSDESQEPSYEVTVTLPSKGLLYKDSKIPAEISLRGMTTKEEKILFGSSGGDVFEKILRNCVTNPKNLDTNELISNDETFLIMQLRMVTYGDDYRVSVECPHCHRRSTYKISLSEFIVNYLDDDFEEPIEVKLPRSGDVLSLKLLRNKDLKFIDRYAKKFAKQFDLNFREVEYTCRMAKFISKINGEDVDFVKARDYVENMYSLDSAKFWTVLNKIVVGIDTTATVTCNECGEDFDFAMPITSEFFRPTIE